MPEMPEIDWHLNFETLMPDWSFEGKKMPDWHRRMPDGNSARLYKYNSEIEKT